MPLTPERRTRILETLADWLDRGCAAEELPEGFPEAEVAAAAEPDLLSVVTALSRLSEDVRLQGKHFRRLQETLEEQRAQSPSDAQKTASSPTPAFSVVAASELIETARDEERNGWLRALIDLHDRLCRTLEEAECQLRNAGRWRRVLGAVPVEKAMVEGLRLTVQRFDELLAAHQTTRFGKVGDRFDPETMKAVDVVEPSKVASAGSGTVSGVVSAGYRCGVKILRYANVQVVK